MRIHYLLIALFVSPLFAQDYAIQKSNAIENFRGVAIVSDQVVWVSGTHGTYLRNTHLHEDHGEGNWQIAQVPGAEALDFRDVAAFSADLAYLLSAGPGELSRIYKTADGGKNWVLQFTNRDPKGFFDCMDFWDHDHGIAVGDPVDGKFVMITTQDGGKNWTPVPPQALPPAIQGEGAFAASGTCITVQGNSNVWFATGGKVARVFRSADGGKSWTVADSPIVHGNDSSGIFSIAFRDARHGVIAGGDYKQPKQAGPNLAFTDDGGLTWKLSKVSPQAFFSAVAFDPKNARVLALGSALTLDIGKKDARKLSDLNLNALSVSATGEILAVGPKGLIVSF
jgi:photosystem II stability/assembly factor-like uncharacterized protein